MATLVSRTASNSASQARVQSPAQNASRPVPTAAEIAERHAHLLAQSVFVVGQITHYKAAKTRNGDDYISVRLDGSDNHGNLLNNITVMAFGEQEIAWLDITPTTVNAGLRISRERNFWRPVGFWTEAGMNNVSEEPKQVAAPASQTAPVETQAPEIAAQAPEKTLEQAPEQKPAEDDLNSLTVAQLRAMCAQAKLTGYSKMKKAELIAFITGAKEEKQAEETAQQAQALTTTQANAAPSESDYGFDSAENPPAFLDEVPPADDMGDTFNSDDCPF